jgi:hypothetical protein
MVMSMVMGLGCGTTKSFNATEQLLVSDAVDGAVAKIDFRPLSGRKVFLDTAFLTSAKSVPGLPNPHLGPQHLVSADYVVSSVRQQMVAAGCLLEEKRELAELVCEIRIGALGTDGHSVTYGIPASNSLSVASTAIAGTPVLPTIPEISLAKRELKSGAAKVAVFAYTSDKHEAVWQSGIEQSNSNSRDTWFLGMGPIQQGSIYKSPRFAGRHFFRTTADDQAAPEERTGVALADRHLFAHALGAKESTPKQSVVTASATDENKPPASPP